MKNLLDMTNKEKIESTKTISDVRKLELLQSLEDYINRYLEKQWVVGEAIDLLGMDSAEKRFLQSKNYEFKVLV